MRFSRYVLAASTVLSFASASPAFADQNFWQSDAYKTNDKDRFQNSSGWFQTNGTIFGLPDDKNKIGQFPNYGGRLEGSVYRAQGNTQISENVNCQGSVGVANVEAYAQVGAGVDTTGPAGSRSYRGTQPRPGSGINKPMSNGKVNGGGVGPAGMINCKAGVEATLISLTGNCETPAGTFGGSVKGPGGQAECGCTGCFAEAYWAKAGADYTTPKIGGCGLQVSGSVGGEVMIGAGIGAAKEGDIGGKVKVGPVGVKGSVNIEEFDTDKMKKCVEDAIAAVKAFDAKVNAAVAAAAQRALANAQSSVRAIGDFASQAWSCIFGCSATAPNPVAATSSAGNTPTVAGSTFPGGSYSSPGSSVALGAATVFTGRAPGIVAPTEKASGAGYAR